MDIEIHNHFTNLLPSHFGIMYEIISLQNFYVNANSASQKEKLIHMSFEI